MEMSGCNDVTMTDHAEKLTMDKGLMSRTVNLMVNNGLIFRKEDPDDRRRKSIVLSEAGVDKTKSINDFMNLKYQTFFKDMDGDEEEEVIRSVKLLSSLFHKLKNCCSGSRGDDYNGCSC